MGNPKYTGDLLWDTLNLNWTEFHKKHPTILKNTYKGKRSYWRKKIESGEVIMPEEPRLTKTWESAAFNRETNEWEHTTLSAYEHSADPNTILEPANQIIVRATRTRPRIAKDLSALIITDLQAWQGRMEDGELYNFHDTTALDIVNSIAKNEQPNEVVIVGDFSDFPSLSRFKQEKAFEDTLNPSLREMQRLLGTIRANNPNAKITLLEGNHEKRLRNYIYDKARHLYGLDALDIRNLLRLSDVEVEYVDGYPNGRYWLNDRLKVIHGETVKQLGKTVTNLIRNDDTSSITGHIHRFEMASRTIPGRDTGRLIMAASFGTLSRIDGAVPSYHSSHDEQGRPMLHIEQSTRCRYGVLPTGRRTLRYPAYHD